MPGADQRSHLRQRLTFLECFRQISIKDSTGFVTGMKISGVAGPLAVCPWRA
jgi:hypothetical protein